MAYSKIILNGDTLMDVTGDTVDAGNLLSGETATKNSGAKVTGNIASKSSSDLTASGATVTAPAGYYSSNASKSVATGTATAPTSISGTSATVSTGTNTLTLSKTVSNTPRITTAGYISSGTAGNSSVSLTASVNTRSSSDLTASGATITAPAGYYASNASKAVASGTAGTPTATKGTVSNHAVNVTPSVTNTTGYITGSTKTGTAVSVSASELVSGTKSITANGTGIDVTDYASVDVSVTPSFTATLTSSGASNVCVKHNNTKYYTSGDTFSFSAGDTLVIVCMKGDSNYFNFNGATVAGGYGEDVDNYNWTMPSDNISIALTAQNGASSVNITANGIPTLITKNITANGTYNASSDSADGYSSVTVNVSGGGIEYETGIYTPTSDTTLLTITFSNVHTTRPFYVVIQDNSDALRETNDNLYFEIYSWYDFTGYGISATSTSTLYARVNTGYKSSSSFGTGGTNINSISGYSTYLTNTAFYPYSSNTRYWRANRPYKWIAVWAPTT